MSQLVTLLNNTWFGKFFPLSFWGFTNVQVLSSKEIESIISVLNVIGKNPTALIVNIVGLLIVLFKLIGVGSDTWKKYQLNKLEVSTARERVEQEEIRTDAESEKLKKFKSDSNETT